MKKLKNVATNQKKSKEKTIEEFHLLIKKAARARQLKTCLYHISQLVEYLEGNSTFDNLRCKWAKEKAEGMARLHSLELQVYNKSKMAYDILKSRVINQKPIELPEIQSIIAELDLLFAGNERNCSPPPWQLAFDGVKGLGIALERIGRTDLLKGLVKLRTIPIRSQTSNSWEFTIEESCIIDHFIFAEGITDLTNLQNNFYFKIEQTPWAIWDKLVAIRWCFRTPFSYWKNKRLRYSSRFYRKESWQRLNLHAMWGEINKIKTSSNKEHEFLIQKKLLFKYLQTFSSEIFNYLNAYQPIDQLHFCLQGECLWIVVKIGQEPDSYHFFMIKELREHKHLYKFVKALAEATSLTSVNVPPGYSVSSLLSHLNMPIGSQLALLFFNGWSAKQVHFKGNLLKGKAIENQSYIPSLMEELKILHEQYKKRFFSPPAEAFLQQNPI